MIEPRLFCLAQWTECAQNRTGMEELSLSASMGTFYLVYGEEAEVEASMLLLHDYEPVTLRLQHKYQAVLHIIGSLNYRLDCVFITMWKISMQGRKQLPISYVVFAYESIYRGTHDFQLCIIVGDVVLHSHIRLLY